MILIRQPKITQKKSVTLEFLTIDTLRRFYLMKIKSNGFEDGFKMKSNDISGMKSNHTLV